MYEADDKMISLIRDNYDLLQSLGSFRISLYWAKTRENFIVISFQTTFVLFQIWICAKYCITLQCELNHTAKLGGASAIQASFFDLKVQSVALQ